jgi:cyclopropane fatty-acyl-phospholipid synthase-like methyltransferase
MTLRAAVVAQFKRPTGALGALAGWIMASRPSNVARNAWTVDLLGVQVHDTVLEIGCGPGLAMERVAAIVQQGQAVGVDHSSVMVGQASRRLAGAIREGRAIVRCMSVDAVPSFGIRFDKIYSANVAQFFPNPVGTFEMLRGMLVPGGTLATTHQPRGKGVTAGDASRAAEKLSAELVAAGFTDIRREVLDLQPVPAVCVLAQK